MRLIKLGFGVAVSADEVVDIAARNLCVNRHEVLNENATPLFEDRCLIKLRNGEEFESRLSLDDLIDLLNEPR